MPGLSDYKFLLGLVVGFLLSAIIVAFKKQIENALDSILSKVPIAVTKFVRYRKWEKKYRKVLYEEHRHLRYVGLKHNITLNRPKLEEVFVNLEIQATSSSGRISPSSELNLLETLNLDVALSKFTHLAILGDPGAGKTTLFEYIVCVCCGAKRRDENRGISGLLPIYVPLRRCASQSRNFIEQLTDPSTRLLPPDLLRTYPPGFFENHLNKGKCVLLFDGLDEVLNEDEHVAAARMVETTAAVFPKCRVLVNSRLAGWRNLLGSRFVRFVIRDLSKREISGLVRQWYLAVIGEQLRSASIESKEKDHVNAAQRIALEQSENMLAVLNASPRLMQIASTPLILSLMCLVFYTRQDLPRKRARLYEECIKILLEEWDRREKQMRFSGMPSLEQKITLLERIAVHLFENSVSELNREEMERVLATYLNEFDIDLKPHEVVRFIEERSGIISEKALGVYGFTHLTFQEFFAAVGLNRLENGLHRLLERFKQTEIEEVVLLYAGIAEKGDLLTGTLLDEYENSSDVRFLLAAGKAIAETRDLKLELKTKAIRALNSAFDGTKDITLLTTFQGVLADLGINREIVRSFGEYNITSEIGRGGMATVYRAIERTTKKAVALKVYNSGTAQQLEHAQQAMSILKKLDHPNLVRILDLGILNDQLFIAMDLLEGRPLDVVITMLDGDGAADNVPRFASVEYYKWCRYIFKGLCAAVSYLHDNRLIHGDIKPGNIYCVGQEAKLLDFGLDHWVYGSHTPRLNSTILSRRIYGTPAYMSPDRFEGRLDLTSDVYSLGKVLQEIWFLERPVAGEAFAKAPFSSKARVGESTLAKQTPAAREVSPAIIRIIEKATDFAQARRYQTVDEMWHDIKKATSKLVPDEA
jgi:hypothetical protein